MSAKTFAICTLCGTQEFIIVIAFLYTFAINIHFDIYFFSLCCSLPSPSSSSASLSSLLRLCKMQNNQNKGYYISFDWIYCDNFSRRWNLSHCIFTSISGKQRWFHKSFLTGIEEPFRGVSHFKYSRLFFFVSIKSKMTVKWFTVPSVLLNSWYLYHKHITCHCTWL